MVTNICRVRFPLKRLCLQQKVIHQAQILLLRRRRDIFLGAVPKSRHCKQKNSHSKEKYLCLPSDMAGLLALVALLGGKNCGFISRRKAVSSKVVLTVASVAFDRSAIRVNGWSRAATKSSAETATAPESTNESRYSALAGQMACKQLISKERTMGLMQKWDPLTGSTTFEALLTGTEGSTHRWTVRLNMAYTTTSVALLAIGRPGLRTVGRLVPRFPNGLNA